MRIMSAGRLVARLKYAENFVVLQQVKWLTSLAPVYKLIPQNLILLTGYEDEHCFTLILQGTYSLIYMQ